MSLQNNIKLHRAMTITIEKIGRPSMICHSDDDFIEYINYCFEFLGIAKGRLNTLSTYSDDDCNYIDSIGKQVVTAHAIIWHCHNYLSGKWDPIVRSSYEDYMHEQSRERTI